MAETGRIKSSPQKWCTWELIILGLTGQKILKFDWWVFIDMEYILAKVSLIFLIISSIYLLLKIGSN